MQHIKFLLSVVTVISGLFVTYQINNVRKKYRFSYLSKLLIYMLIVIVLFSVLMFAIYFKLNLPDDFVFNRSSLMGNIVNFTSIALFFFLSYLMFLIVTDMLGMEAKSSYKSALGIFLIFASAVEYLSVFLPELLNSQIILKLIYGYIVDNLIFLEIILLVFLIIKGKKIPDARWQKAVVTFGYIFILRYVILIIGYLTFVITGFSKQMIVLVQIFILISVILLPYYWIRVYFLKYAENLSDKNDLQPQLDNICRNHGISDREKEIILLMIRGKTNKEIEEELFISINTVKNHVYSIFKKLKIKSRHQLVKFFTGI